MNHELTPSQKHKFEIMGRPEYSMIRVQLSKNESLRVEASAMATMDTHIKMKTKLKGGFSRFLQGENLFINEFTAEGAPGVIDIAPGPPGDIEHTYLNNEVIYLQSSSFVASSMGVNVESKWQGLTTGFFSGAGLFLIRCHGTGDLWFNSFGGIFKIDVKGETVVDTGHIVGFTDGLDYRISKVGGYKSLFLSGEGLVVRFQGQGHVWVQNRQLPAFAQWIQPFRSVESKN